MSREPTSLEAYRKNLRGLQLPSSRSEEKLLRFRFYAGHLCGNEIQSDGGNSG
jgi:hypothetical protein